MSSVPERRRTRRVAVRVVRRPWVVHERPLAGRGWSADGRSVGFGAPPWHTQPDILAARDDLQELAFFLVLLICGFHISLKDLSLPLLIMSVVPVCLSRRAARARRGGQVIGRRVMGRRVTAPSDRSEPVVARPQLTSKACGARLSVSEGGRHVARREDDKCASYGSLFIGQSSGTQVETEGKHDGFEPGCRKSALAPKLEGAQRPKTIF